MASAAGLLAAARADDTNPNGWLTSAVGPVVYRLDESPAAHGYHDTFFGNAFFIKSDGCACPRHIQERGPAIDSRYSPKQPAADVFLLSHPVTPGQSGSPVLAADSHLVVGLIEGRWVRNGSVSIARARAQPAEPPGPAIPIRYAVSLLKQNGVAYHFAQSAGASADLPGKEWLRPPRFQ